MSKAATQRQIISVKLGKHPPKFDVRTLQFGANITAGMPSPPPSVDYAKAVPEWPTALKIMSGEFYQAYMDEAFAVLSNNWMEKKLGTFPNGFDLEALKHDLAEVGG